MAKSRKTRRRKEPQLGATNGNPDQYARFLEAARALECDDSEERFAEMVRRIAKAPVPSPAEMTAKAKDARKTKAPKGEE